MDCKDLIVLICEILYLFVKGPSSIVNKFSNQIENCSIESQVHTLIQNKMLSNFSFQAVYRITTFWNDFFIPINWYILTQKAGEKETLFMER